ncbi:UNVERIFIED_CONTAM: C18orf63 [Trichonephila clavipes]
MPDLLKTFLFFLNIPDLNNLLTIYLNIHSENNPRLRSLFHLKILKCRELIFKDSSVITCPVKDMSPPRIIIAKTKLNCLEFRETLRKMELKIIKIEETTPLALQECLQYTWTAKMAPSWNILQNFLVQGKKFYIIY